MFEQHSLDLVLIRELGINLVASLDTHVHADHVTGSWLMHEASGADALKPGEGLSRAAISIAVWAADSARPKTARELLEEVLGDEDDGEEEDSDNDEADAEI